MDSMEYAHTALPDSLVGALVGLARPTDGNEHLISASSTAVILEGLTSGTLEDAALEDLLKRVEAEKRNMVPDCFTCASPCGRNSDYDMTELRKADREVQALKYRLLSGIQEMAGHIREAGCCGETSERFLYKALIVIGMDAFGAEELQPILQEFENENLRCKAMRQ